MCKLASFVVTRERVLWHPESDSHEKIIEKYNLDDKKKCNFVRVELAPPNNDYLLPLKKWEYKVDEKETPTWYNKRNAEEAVRDELVKWRKKRQWFFDAMDFVATIKDVKWYSHCGKTLKGWKVYSTGAAARAAAWDAARDAAWDAAWDAAGDAARDAAGDAARDAARAAAWAAAWAAARAAAWAAESRVQVAHLTELIERLEKEERT